MKALSIKQPWAWLIVNGFKDIENRNWKYPPGYRGSLLIHASKSFDHEGFRWVRKSFPNTPMPGAHRYIGKDEIEKLYDLGGFVGTSYLNDVVTFDNSPWFFGPLGFRLRQSKPIDFIPYKGQLGLFDVPEQVKKMIKAQNLTT